MNHQSRRILTPVASRKRKERESMAPGPEVVSPSAPPATLAASKPAPDNKLLAGYMAYEFLTKGTILGQRFDPARAEVGSAAPKAADFKKPEAGTEPSGREEHGSYAEVARILKTDGAHIPGIVNPTQLARWIQM